MVLLLLAAASHCLGRRTPIVAIAFAAVDVSTLLQRVVHADSTDQVQGRQQDQLLLHVLLRDEVAKGDEDEDPAGDSRSVKASGATAFGVSHSRADVCKS